MRRGRTSTIPDEGYADGGTPYTDEEMDIIDAEEAAGKGRMAPGAPLEGLPTPPLARDRAAETGEDVQDCFGGWHGGSHEGRPPGGRPKAGLDFERLVRRVVAEESEGARRERQIHELEQQYGTPAHESDNRRMPSVRDAVMAQKAAADVLNDMLGEPSAFGRVMDAAYEQNGVYENDRNILQMSKAIAAGDPKAREWFSRLADALETYDATHKMLNAVDPDALRYKGME